MLFGKLFTNPKMWMNGDANEIKMNGVYTCKDVQNVPTGDGALFVFKTEDTVKQVFVPVGEEGVVYTRVIGEEWASVTGTSEETEALIQSAIDKANQAQAKADTVDTRLNNIIVESGTSDAEVVAARTDSSGQTFTTLGVRLDTQFSEIKEDLGAVSPAPSLTWTIGKNVDALGKVSDNVYTALSGAFMASGGDVLIRQVPDKDTNNKSLIFYVNQYAGETFISRSTLSAKGDSIIIGDTTTSVRVAFGRTSGTGVNFTQNDMTYFSYELYRKALTYDMGMVNRGSISSLGFSSIGECKEQGYYTFGSNDTLSDLPAGWYMSGGLVVVYKNGNTIWQRLIGLKYRFIRYGTTAEWRNEVDLVRAEYINETGENNSVSKLNIYVPRDTKNRRTMYQMGHCVDESANSDVWRIMFAYRVDSNETQRKLTMRGEWECAIKLDGRSDFSGGIVHGDEVDADVKVFVDGTLTDITALNTFCHELKIVRHSNLYDPNDSTTIIAEHGVEYIYSADGLKINQSITWKVSATLANCYLAMLPIIKIYSKYRYDDTSFLVAENKQTNYAITIPNAKSVTEYSTEYDCSVTMSIPTYPTGLTGGDCALITDNNGLNYNKVYFPVCTSGISQINEVWKSTTVFKNR